MNTLETLVLTVISFAVLALMGFLLIGGFHKEMAKYTRPTGGDHQAVSPPTSTRSVAAVSREQERLTITPAARSAIRLIHLFFLVVAYIRLRRTFHNHAAWKIAFRQVQEQFQLPIHAISMLEENGEKEKRDQESLDRLLDIHHEADDDEQEVPMNCPPAYLSATQKMPPLPRHQQASPFSPSPSHQIYLEPDEEEDRAAPDSQTIRFPGPLSTIKEQQSLPVPPPQEVEQESFFDLDDEEEEEENELEEGDGEEKLSGQYWHGIYRDYCKKIAQWSGDGAPKFPFDLEYRQQDFIPTLEKLLEEKKHFEYLVRVIRAYGKVIAYTHKHDGIVTSDGLRGNAKGESGKLSRDEWKHLMDMDTGLFRKAGIVTLKKETMETMLTRQSDLEDLLDWLDLQDDILMALMDTPIRKSGEGEHNDEKKKEGSTDNTPTDNTGEQ